MNIAHATTSGTRIGREALPRDGSSDPEAAVRPFKRRAVGAAGVGSRLWDQRFQGPATCRKTIMAQRVIGKAIASRRVVCRQALPPLHCSAMRALSKSAVRELYRRLAETRPIPQTELEFINPFTLLVAVVLSAQATDAGVNKATPALFALADTPAKMLALGEERLTGLIRTIGLFRTKAKNLMALSRILVDQYGGEVPRERAALEALPGVGRKTASVVLNVAFGEPTIAVDTHIFRVANRTGLAPGKTPLAVEIALEARTPPQYKRYAHHWLILHGRYVCKARKPECPTCVVSDLCRYGAKTGPAELIAARAGGGEPAALTDAAGDPLPAEPARSRAPRPAAKSRVS
jgi:endonuclease-3